MGVVYMLAFENLYYIGSTIQKLNERIIIHKSDYKRFLNGKSKHFCRAFDIIKNKDYKVIMIEEVKNETKEDCREREQFWIDFYGKENLINKYNANGLDKDNHKKLLKNWNYNNQEKRKQISKKYYEKKKKLLDIII